MTEHGDLVDRVWKAMEPVLGFPEEMALAAIKAVLDSLPPPRAGEIAAARIEGRIADQIADIVEGIKAIRQAIESAGKPKEC